MLRSSMPYLHLLTVINPYHQSLPWITVGLSAVVLHHLIHKPCDAALQSMKTRPTSGGFSGLAAPVKKGADNSSK